VSSAAEVRSRVGRKPSAASADAPEIEWQFDAVDLDAVARWLGDQAESADVGDVIAVPAETTSHVDLYLDTEDQRFHRAGFSLRIRRVGRRREAEATLKSLDEASGEPGIRRRREISERLERSDPAALREAGGPVGERARAVAGRKRLVSLFEVRTRRRVVALEQDGRPAGEVALDETAIGPASGRPQARLRRVEIEGPEAVVSMLGPFVDRLRLDCGLQPAGLSKYEAGLLSAGVRPPLAESFDDTEIDADSAIGDVALAVVRRQFAIILAKELGTRLGDDIEELHDMRVASRRLRASLSLFADVLPAGVMALRDDLRWLGGALGAVRDLDVQLEQLEQWIATSELADADALAALRLLLEDQRRSARTALLEVFDSRRYSVFVGRFRRTLRARHSRRSGAAALPARAVAPDLIESRVRQFRKHAKRVGPDSPSSAYHRLRTDTKRLRYALEFLADVYPDRTRRPVKRLVVLQDILGLHQDAEIARQRLRQLAVDPDTALPPETIFALGEIAERYRHDMVALRREFPAAYARTKSLRPLRKRIEAQRPVAPVAAERAARSTPADREPLAGGAA
jgi:CHAD domain-containing protein